jgi:hypothetical protein
LVQFKRNVIRFLKLYFDLKLFQKTYCHKICIISVLIFSEAIQKPRLPYQPTDHEIRKQIISDMKHARDRDISRRRREGDKQAMTSKIMIDLDDM